MICFDGLTYHYPGAEVPVLSNLTLEIDEGELLLVLGPSGAGKSTLLRCLNGLVPHFYGGTVAGQVRVDSRDPVALGPIRCDLARPQKGGARGRGSELLQSRRLRHA